MFKAFMPLTAAAFAATLLVPSAVAADDPDATDATDAAAQADTMAGPEAIDFAKYTTHSSTLAAVVSAMAMLEPCPVALAFSDEVIESYETVELTISCDAGEDQEAAVILRFLMLENGFLLPQSYEFAG